MKGDMKCGCEGRCGACGGKTAFFGRVLIASLFLMAGWTKLTGFAAAEQMVAGAGFPAPAFFAVLAIIFEFGGGLLLLTGFHARLAAWMLIVFTAVATAAYHNPFSGDQLAMIMFLKNLAIIGGLLYVTAFGPGKWSLSKWNTKICKGGSMCPDCGVDTSGASAA